MKNIINKGKTVWGKIIKSSFWHSKYFPYLMILIFSILLLWPSVHGQFHIGDDQLFHMANIKVFSDGLPFSIFSKVLPEMANNFGFGVGIFYPPLPHIVGAFIYKFISLFGAGLITTETILHFFIFFTSGVTMYLFGKEIFKDNKKGLIAALFYITYNYFYVDVVIRDALNEAFIFIFIPLVFLGLYNLFINHNTKKFYICFASGYVGLMYSHLVMSVWFTIFLVVFLLFFIKDIFKKKNFWHLCLAALLILIFTSTFTVPMLEHKFSDVEYVAFAKRVWSIDTIWAMPFNGFFESVSYRTGFDFNPGLIYSNLNFIVIIFFVISIFKLFNKKVNKNFRKFMIALSVFAILGIILNSWKAIWLYVPSILLSIQFPWRLATFVGFGFAIVAAYALDSYLNIFKTKFIPIALTILIVFLGYFVINNNQTTKFITTLEPLNVSTTGAVREHFPTKIYKNKDEFWEKEYKISVIEGQADVKILDDDSPYMKFKAQNIEDKVIIELPRIYYLGYEITDSKGNKIDYDFNDPGYISLELTKDGVYELKYVGTTAYQIAFIVKGITIIGLIIFVIIYYRRNTKK